MGDPFGFAAARERQRELLREAEERRIARSLRKVRRGKGDHERQVESMSVDISWGLTGDEPAVADLLELNGMPRWISFEERFVVAREDGKVRAAVCYRTESKRLILGLLVVDPWAGEERLAHALYRGAGELARELGVHEVVVTAWRARYPGRAGYRRRGRGWRLDVRRLSHPDNMHGPLHTTVRS